MYYLSDEITYINFRELIYFITNHGLSYKEIDNAFESEKITFEDGTLYIKDIKVSVLQLHSEINNFTRKIKSFEFENIQTQIIHVKNLKSNELGIYFKKSTIEKIEIVNCNFIELFIDEFKCFNSKKNVSLNLETSTIASLRIDNSDNNIEGISIGTDHPDARGSVYFKHLSLADHKANILLSSIKIGLLGVRNINSNQLEINYCLIRKIQLTDLNDTKYVYFDHLRNSDILIDNEAIRDYGWILSNYILSENIPSVHFDKCRNTTFVFNTSKIDDFEFDIRDSDITNSKFHNTRLPEKVALDYIWDRPSTREKFYQDQKETILQLKTIAENHNDSSALVKIKRLEQMVNFKLISFWKEPLETIVLWLNKWSTNFGVNWVWSSLEYIVFGYLFFAIISLLNSLSIIDWNVYFQFLNPAHRMDIFGVDNFHSLTGFIDFFARLVFAYLAVQTVTAFRKTFK